MIDGEGGDEGGVLIQLLPPQREQARGNDAATGTTMRSPQPVQYIARGWGLKAAGPDVMGEPL